MNDFRVAIHDKHGQIRKLTQPLNIVDAKVLAFAIVHDVEARAEVVVNNVDVRALWDVCPAVRMPVDPQTISLEKLIGVSLHQAPGPPAGECCGTFEVTFSDAVVSAEGPPVPATPAVQILVAPKLLKILGELVELVHDFLVACFGRRGRQLIVQGKVSDAQCAGK